ncbi:MAG: AI-2E family transporter [Bacteroidia bacterium]
MEILQKYKHEIILAICIIGFTLAFLKLYAILLPFILGLIFAFASMPLIIRIQRVVKKRALATTLFIFLLTVSLLLAFVFSIQFINRDFQRINQSFSLLASNNQAEIDNTARKVKEYIGGLYDFDQLESTLRNQADSLSQSVNTFDSSQLDTEAIQEAYAKVISVFQNGEDEEKEKDSGFGFLYMLFSSILYFVLILYQFDYFKSIRQKYGSSKMNTTISNIFEDFNQSFIRYFKLRTKIVLLLSTLYFVTFLILDIPGMIMMMGLIIILSYITYLQYLALIPLALSCLVLSIEHDHSFLFYYGIVGGVFILASIIEELVLTPRIMEKNIGMNPVIMVLALSVWSYLLGFVGLLLGIPLTSLLIIYVKRYFIPSYSHLLIEGAQNE